MQGDDVTGFSTGVECLGAILGGCRFSNELVEKLNDTLENTRFYSWIPHLVHERTTLNPENLRGSVARFHEDGVSHVLHAGNVNLEVIKAFFREEAPQVVNGRSLDNPLSFFTAYADMLAGSGIALVSVRDLFEEYSVRPGIMGRIQPDVSMATRMADLYREAQYLCGVEIFVRVAQAVIFDIGPEPRQVVETIGGTDMLLKSLATKPPGTMRILMKLLPEAMPAMINDPTIGTTTVDLAARAGVNIIAIEAAHGIIIDRTDTIAAANSAGIALIGI